MADRSLDASMLRKLDEKGRYHLLMRRAGVLSNALLEGVSRLDGECMKDVMEMCGRSCAAATGNLEEAERIASLGLSLEEKLDRLNAKEVWCGRWVYDGEKLEAVCGRCGCPLVTNGVVELSGTMCHCSRGWVKAVFETLLGKPVSVELLDSIGLGGDSCRFAVTF
ncbi:hypothetical protein JXL21_00365 [Candidatus Bathyarchaeota archaeon]|nr:hypothetical protein [Candidatus Bathyarchaeota archaeon]